MTDQTIQRFFDSISDERKPSLEKLHTMIRTNLPRGFETVVSIGMLNYVVPLATYPKGYHTHRGEPLPFISLALQKNHIALYHMGLYGNPEVLKWFEEAYVNHDSNKLDMGKSCIRFKHVEHIPYDLIGTLCQKISVETYIAQYEAVIRR